MSSSGVRWRRQFQAAIDPQWFGALIEDQSPGFDSGPAIQAAKLVAEARKLILALPNGMLNCSSDVVINPGTTIYGNGQEVSEIKMTGTAKFISLREHTVDFADLRDFKIRQGGTATRGLDIGTLRRSTVTNVYVFGFTVGVVLDMGVNLVANYWNRLTNVTAECTGQLAVGSIGFLFGTNIHATYPDTDYNVLIGCKSFQCETALFGVNMIGCNITGHQCTVVGTALNLLSGNNNKIQLVAENCLRMGGAAAAANGNILDLYNDGDLATPFEDNGWNFHQGQILGQQLLANASREIDSFVKDRINSSHTGANRSLFIVTTDAPHAAYTVTTTCSGYIAGTSAFASIQVWDVIRNSGGTPVVTLVRTTGDAVLYTTVAPNGEVVWYINGTAGQLTVANTTVNIQGFSTTQSNPYAKFINYKRAF